jgi:hypothetical protein
MTEHEAHDALVLAASENGLISVTIIDAIVAYRAAVRAETLREVRGAVEGMRPPLLTIGTYVSPSLARRNAAQARMCDDILSRLDALAHPEGT